MTIQTNQRVTTPQGYHLEREVPGTGWYLFYHHTGGNLFRLTEEEVQNIHRAIAMLGCDDETCPCREHGREHGLGTPREPLGT